MIEWDVLDTELDQWAEADGVATFWWRDDDAHLPAPALSRLIELSESHGVPLGLAVIPAKAGDALLAALTPGPRTDVLQHGFAHVNHAPSNEKASEYGGHRPASVMTAEIAAGSRRLRAIFDKRFLPLFVPPWNRFSGSLTPVLPSLGLLGVSTFAPRRSPSPAPGLRQVNTHVDLISWRRGRVFKGTARLAGEIAAHLSARRREEVDGGEPTGILSHHLVHDIDCWRFLEQLFERTCGHENVRWLTPREALDT